MLEYTLKRLTLQESILLTFESWEIFEGAATKFKQAVADREGALCLKDRGDEVGLKYGDVNEENSPNFKWKAYRMTKKPNRNDPCSCGSGKKYKKCCGQPGMGKHKATLLDPAKVTTSLLGRISQAGEAFSADRKINVMTKNVTIGKLTPNAEESKPEAPKEENNSSSQEKDLS